MENLEYITENLPYTEVDFFKRLCIIIAIGFIIGLERERIAIKDKVKEYAGIRTFTGFALAGFLAMFLAVIFSKNIILVAFLSVTVLVAISFWSKVKAGKFGITIELFEIIIFMVGITVYLGFITEALLITFTIVLLYSLKPKFQFSLGKITQEEVYAFLVFIALYLLVIPFLPDEHFGPYNALNPREIGIVIVLTSGIGFIGYILMKYLGSGKGILFTGIIGGLVSSTVVTWMFSKKSKETPQLSLSYSVAILAASVIMVARVLIWAYIFNPNLASVMLLPILSILLATIAVCLYYYKLQKNAPKVDSKIKLGNPLNLKEGIAFGIIYSIILIVVQFSNKTFGEEGVLVSSFIAGLTDIDAITISISKLAGNSISVIIAQTAIILAILSNILVKASISFSSGSKQLKKYLGVGYGTMFLTSVFSLILINKN